MKLYSRFRRPVVSGLICPEHSLTEQVYKEQCDLNFLIRKFRLEDDPFQLEMMVDPQTRAMSFIDTTEVPDIYKALREHQRVKHIFEGLDYAIQAKFNFSVDAFAQYVLTADVKDINALGIENLHFDVSQAVKVPESVSQDTKPEESSSKA